MTEEEYKEAALQIRQQYGITQEQIEAFADAFYKLYMAVKDFIEKIAAAYKALAELIDTGRSRRLWRQYEERQPRRARRLIRWQA